MIQTMKISLLIIVVAIKLEVTASRTDRCSTGDVRLLAVNGINYLEYCRSSRWRQMCGGEWGTNEARVACRQLGYENAEGIPGFANLASEYRTSSYFEIDDGCCGTEDSIRDCDGVRSDSCSDSDQIATIQCQTTLVQSCIGGSMRLVSGSSYNEGRVEVCFNREWGTVCNNNQALPGAVCQKLGFYADGATIASRFVTESLPDNICTVQDESEVNCRPRSTTLCSSELGVECQRLTCSEHYTQLEDLQCERMPVSTNPPPTTLPCPTIPKNTCPPPVIITTHPQTTSCNCPSAVTPISRSCTPTLISTKPVTDGLINTTDLTNENSSMRIVTASTMMNAVLGSLTGLLAILLLATTIALVFTCAALKKKSAAAARVKEESRNPQNTNKKPLPLPISANLQKNPAYGDVEKAYKIVEIVQQQ